MTKKDYVKIAKLFREAKTFGNREDGSLVYSDEILHDLVEVLADDNPRFDRERFLRAAGIEKCHGCHSLLETGAARFVSPKRFPGKVFDSDECRAIALTEACK